jgi:uncharacterized protein YkwD
MTVYLPRRFVLVAVSAAVLALVAGLLLLSGPDGDGPAAALTAGTAGPASTLVRSAADPAPTMSRRWPVAPTTGATVAAVAPTSPPPPPPPPEPATTVEPPATTARRSPATTSAPANPPAPAAAAVAAPATSAAPTTAPPPPPTTTAPIVVGSDSSLAAAVVAGHNRERAARGLAPLQRSACLDGIATAWAAHLAAIGRLAHNPGAAVAAEACVLWTAVGENLGFDGTVDDLEQAWMDSAVHQANILDPDFTQVGVGVVRRDGILYAVVDFAG